METLQASVSVALHAIERLIFTTRGQRVMLDSDLARVYGVATRRLNEQGRRKLPLVFTEHGAIMAANVLNTPAVVQASVQVVRAFVRLREMALSNLELARRLDELENRYDGQFGVVFDALRQLMSPPPAPRIGFRLTKDGAKQEAKKGTRVPGSHGNGRTVSGETAAHDAGGTDSQAQREHPLQVGGSWSHDGVGCPDHHGRPAGRSREPKGPHPMPTPIALLFLFSVALPGAFAWNGHEVTEGPLRLFIPEIPEVTAPAEPTTVQVEVENTGQAQVTGQLEVRDFVDGWHVVGAGKKPFALAAGATQQLEFALAANPPVYSALYPVHAHAVFRDGGKERTVRAVRIFSVRVPTKQEAASAGGEFVVNTVPKDSALPLWMLGTQRVAWNYYDGPPVFEAPGWSGSSPQSSANMGVGSLTRGDTRASINMHPPWKPGGGAIFCDYLLKLPDQRPIKLVFAVAIRDSAEKEPPSDGVLFRVWTGEDRQGKDAKVLYEQFTAAKRWLDGSANLSAYAGKTVLVRL
ncbi:MAG: ORF6N domain-containing protein, partial [Armatimonadetes bacterium]|nr:ORF6N domain-containing protein [Armatimonadota bacterium]